MTTFSAQPGKITADHLQRRAVVYVRQSSDHQVRHNLESQRLQYALVDRARSLGFAQVEVVDADQGISAAMGHVRPGFDRMLASVARGEVGIVLAREVSRLSRNDKDFCRLVELCQVFATLLGDADQVYDPALMDDQLVLGIKGTLSVVELRVLRMRLVQGMRSKASRGAFQFLLPPGFEWDADGQMVLDPNERVRQAIGYVFDVFRQTASVRQTMIRLQHESFEVPVRKQAGDRWRLTWQLPRSSFVGSMLRNACYAGAYVWGRRPLEHRFEDGRLQHRQAAPLPLDQCAVALWDHHPGYLSREQYEENQRIMTGNAPNSATGSAVRTGRALLTGLLRCARCGRRFKVKYWLAAGVPGRYLCDGAYVSGGRYCLAVSGGVIDAAVSAEVVRVLSPLGLQASRAALADIPDQRQGKRQALTLREQQVAYEAQLAHERYEHVDARNRLVAADLERRWNDKLVELAEIRTEFAGLDAVQPANVQAQRDAIDWLGGHFAEVWNSEHCPIELKKRLVRTVIEEIIVDVTETQILLTVHWQGGAHTPLAMNRPNRKTAQANSGEDLEIIGQMAPRYSDDQISQVLSRLGRVTGKGKRWTRQAVKDARNKAGIAGGNHPKVDPDLLSMNAAARHVGVSDTTIRRLTEAGPLCANIAETVRSG